VALRSDRKPAGPTPLSDNDRKPAGSADKVQRRYGAFVSIDDRISFQFDEVVRSVSLDEALILSDWLHKTRVLAAGPLVEQLDAEIQTSNNDVIELDADSRAVLRDLLADTDLGDFGGLRALAQALRGEILNEPTEDV
jgi:hypothetical protein